MANPFAAHPNPARDYGEAATRADALLRADGNDVNPVCKTQFLTHGNRAERSIVFFHGASNCPRQFCQLGDEFFALGYNVLIPRLPHHGLSDRLTRDMRHLTAQKLIRATDEAIDIARGLGEHVTVAGLSMGGVLAGWAALERADVDQAVMISPALAPKGMKMSTVSWLAPLLCRLPNAFVWWNRKREENVGPAHAYPRVSTRGLAQVFRLSAYVYREAMVRTPQARRVIVTTTETDPSLENAAAETIARRWQEQGYDVDYQAFCGFPVIHDIIDPDQPNACIANVYPQLVELIEGQPVSER